MINGARWILHDLACSSSRPGRDVSEYEELDTMDDTAYPLCTAPSPGPRPKRKMKRDVDVYVVPDEIPTLSRHRGLGTGGRGVERSLADGTEVYREDGWVGGLVGGWGEVDDADCSLIDDRLEEDVSSMRTPRRSRWIEKGLTGKSRPS